MTTVLSIVNEMLKDGLIIEEGVGDSSTGRKPIWLEINPDGGYFIGIEFYSDYVYGLILNLKDEKVYSKRIRLTDKSEQSIFLSIKECISEFIDYLGEEKKNRIFGIGIGVPGPIDKKQGISIKYDYISGWSNIHIKEEIERTFGIKTYIENNMKAMALAYKWFVLGSKRTDFAFISIRTGIGGAYILNNRLYQGYNGLAGEIAHLYLPGCDKSCYCGNKGCLETEVSNEAIIKKIKLGIEKGKYKEIIELADGDIKSITIDSFIESVKMGHLESIQLFEEEIKYLGIAVSNIVSILNPSRIIINGDITKVGKKFLHILKKEIKEHVSPLVLKNLTLEISVLDEDIGALGAASLVKQNEFDFIEEF